MQTQPVTRSSDIAVVGGGPIGLLAACALATTSRKVACIAPADPRADGRTTALLVDAVDDLRSLGVWEGCAPYAAALRTMRLLDGTRRLIRARPLEFHASELGLDAFGYNVPNERLVAGLNAAAERANVDRHDAVVRSVDPAAGRLVLSNDLSISARLLVGADGRQSLMREAAGIPARSWHYDQVAVVLTFSHTQPHNGVSVELHRETGPFTQVPLPPTPDRPNRSSLVWVERPAEGARLLDAPDEALAETIRQRFQGAWGEIAIERRPQSFPLSGQVALTAGKGRTVLVGEATHVFPPIGAQGANLGFRDVRDLVRHVREQPLDAVSDAYARSRAVDIGIRTAGVDMLNRSLLTGLLPVQAGRFAAAELMARSGSLRRALMKAGLAPSGGAQRDGNGSIGSRPVVMT